MSVVSTRDPQTSRNPVEAQNNLFCIFNTAIAVFLGGSDPAVILHRIHYWLKNEYSGYLTKDGKKWIYNGYLNWVEQFSWISVGQIGRIVRHLETIGWVETAKFSELKKGIGFVGKNPSGFQDDNQTKFYRLNYQRIYIDTGVDLLFEKKAEENQSAAAKSPKPARGNDSPPTQSRKRAPRANLQNCTLQSSNLNTAISKSEDSSIYKEFPTSTKLSKEESENLEFTFEQQELNDEEVHDSGTDVKGFEKEICESCGQVEKVQKEVLEHALIPEVDQCSAAPLPTEKIVKYERVKRGTGMGQVRPPRQSPKMRYPDGEWLTEGGYLNKDFVMDQVKQWRTGDTTNSKSFGQMADEDVAARVATHYAKPENHYKLEIHWVAYVDKSKRYIVNVGLRVDSGIQIPESEQGQILAKFPAIVSEPVEPAFEYSRVSDELALHLLSQPSIPSLLALAPEKTTTPPPPIDEKGGCQNPQAYTNTAKEEDRDYWANVKIQPQHPKVGVQPKNISSVGKILETKDFKPEPT